MSYNVTDLIAKTIDIEMRRKELYENITKDKEAHSPIKIMSKVLIKQVDKTINDYKSLKMELTDIELEDIDFWTYDKICFLINQYNKKQYQANFITTKEYLKFSLELERDMYSLLIDVQGRLVKCKEDTYSNTYKVLSEMITSKVKHIETLEKILK